MRLVGDETKMGAEISRRALLSLLLLSVRLSIFNLSCGLPIGLSATRRRVIGRQTQCATLAPSFPLSRLRSSAAMQGGFLAFSLLHSYSMAPHLIPPFRSLLSRSLLPLSPLPSLCSLCYKKCKRKNTLCMADS